MAKFKFKSKKGAKKTNFFSCRDILDKAKKITGSKIEILANKEITVDGCRGILEYSDTYIKIRIPDGVIILTGGSFDIPVFDGPVITVCGTISTVEFCVR